MDQPEYRGEHVKPDALSSKADRLGSTISATSDVVIRTRMFEWQKVKRCIGVSDG
jgi:hypothetical protein